MLDAARIDLSKYRLERAEEMLKTARRDLDAGDYASANNRAYYCVFHAMRALLPPELSKIISMASIIRNRSDYEDFYICSISDTKKLVSDAALFLDTVTAFLETQYNE